jgi:WD40 repeat protein
VLLCDPATGGMVGRLAGQEHHPAALAWDRHGKYLAVGDGERIIVWDAGAGTQRRRLPWAVAEGDRGPDGTVTSVQWLDGGGYLLEFRPRGGAYHDERGTTVATVLVWDIEDGQAVCSKYFLEHEKGRIQPVAGVCLSPDGRRLAAALDFLPPDMWRITGDLPQFIA